MTSILILSLFQKFNTKIIFCFAMERNSAHIFMQSSGQQGSGPEGVDVSDSSPPPTPPPFEKVRDFDLWPGKQRTVRMTIWRAKVDHEDLGIVFLYKW